MIRSTFGNEPEGLDNAVGFAMPDCEMKEHGRDHLKIAFEVG